MILCGECRWRDADEYCTCPKIHEYGRHAKGANEAEDHLIYSYSEGGYFWVGEKFGCVHGERKPDE